MMPDPKTFKQHFENKHPSAPLPDELKDAWWRYDITLHHKEIHHRHFICFICSVIVFALISLSLSWLFFPSVQYYILLLLMVSLCGCGLHYKLCCYFLDFRNSCRNWRRLFLNLLGMKFASNFITIFWLKLVLVYFFGRVLSEDLFEGFHSLTLNSSSFTWSYLSSFVRNFLRNLQKLVHQTKLCCISEVLRAVGVVHGCISCISLTIPGLLKDILVALSLVVARLSLFNVLRFILNFSKVSYFRSSRCSSAWVHWHLA
jgi:hypothetical protein